MNNYKDYLKATRELGLKPLRIDEFESLLGALDMNSILRLTEQIQSEKPMGPGGK
jgi:hypothetical protein